MAKSVDDITNEAIKHGGMLALLYFDLHGKSKEAVQNILVGFIAKISKENGVVYSYGEIEEPIEFDGMFSASAEFKLLAKDYSSLQKICGQYSPIGIEILRPSEINLTLGEAQNALLEVSMLSQNFVHVMMDKLMTPEEKADYQKKMLQQAELGKRLVEKKG